MSKSGLGKCPKCDADTGYDHIHVRGELVHILVESGEPRVVVWDSYRPVRFERPYYCRTCNARFSREDLLRLAAEQIQKEEQRDTTM